MYKVWIKYCDKEDTQEELECLLQKVSQQRREKALRYRFLSDRLLSLRAYCLLLEGLAEFGITDLVELEIGSNGKPYISGHPEVFFNLSHCKKAVLCAISDKPIGVDVEVAMNPINQELLSYCMNKEEQADILNAEDSGMRFAFWWTRKEALLKQTGEGLTNQPKDVLRESESYSFESHESPEFGIAYTICIKKKEGISNNET